MKIGIIRERKDPPDSRVPLSPTQCQLLQTKYGLEILVESSPNRCFTDEEYQSAGIQITDQLEDCEVLLGVKEVPIDHLIPHKTYFFFSHTIKKQSYNRKLLQAVLQKEIRLIDYEVLTNHVGQRLIAFGKFAGMVGAHNGILTYGRRTQLFDLIRMKDCYDYEAAKTHYKALSLPPMKVVLTGGGRVASGAASVLEDIGIRRVEPSVFLNSTPADAIYTQLDCEDYAARKDGKAFDLSDFFKNPGAYKSIFLPFAHQSDVMINGIFWDNQAPVFFTLEEMADPKFKIQVIADVTCDIAPVSSIPATIRASTIADPIFGFDPSTQKETLPHQASGLDMMTIDNLPNEMPRDASKAFGDQFIESIVGELLSDESSNIIERGTVAKNGQLGSHFDYLKDYVAGKE